MNLQTLLTSFLITLSLFTSTAKATAVRYEDLPRLVAERNENVKASALTVKAQTERTGRLARSFLPNVSAIVGQEEFKAGSVTADQQAYWRIQGSLNLYRGGGDKIEDQIRSTQTDLARLSYVGEMRTELREAKVAYWKAVATSKLILERKEALQSNETNIKSARRRAGAGITTTADAAQFELHKISLERDLKKLDLDQHRILNQLSVALALDEHESIQVAGDFPAIDSGSKAAPLETNKQVDVRSYQKLQGIDELRAEQVSRWLLPKLDLYASYGLPSLSDEYARALRKDNEWVAGIRLTMDLGEGIEDLKEASARRAEAEATKLRGTHKLREVIANDHDLRHDLGVVAELVQDSETNVSRAQNFLKMTQAEYSRGVKNGPDLLEAFQKYFEFRESRIQYLREYFETKAQLESLNASAEPS